MFVPNSMLKQLYTLGSLKKTQSGLSFSLKNRIKSAHFNQILHLSINEQRVDSHKIMISLDSEQQISLHTFKRIKVSSFHLAQY